MSDSIKRNLIGILAAIGLVSLLPFYMASVALVFVIALQFFRTQFGIVAAALLALLFTAAGDILFGGYFALFVLCLAVIVLLAASLTMRPGIKVERAVITVFAALLAVIFGGILVVRVAAGDIVTIVFDYVKGYLGTFEETLPGFWEYYSSLLGIEGVPLEDVFYQAEELIRLHLVGDIISVCVYGSAIGVMMARRPAFKRGVGEKVGAAFNMYKWSLPRYTGRILGSGAAVFYAISVMGNARLSSAAYAVWMLVYSLFVLQGMVYLDFTMQVRGSRSWVRFLLITALFLFLRPMLLVYGVMDRFVPIRKHMDGMRAVTTGDLAERIKKMMDKDEGDD